VPWRQTFQYLGQIFSIACGKALPIPNRRALSEILLAVFVAASRPSCGRHAVTRNGPTIFVSAQPVASARPSAAPTGRADRPCTDAGQRVVHTACTMSLRT
jgi:hypothetical protein